MTRRFSDSSAPDQVFQEVDVFAITARTVQRLQALRGAPELLLTLAPSRQPWGWLSMSYERAGLSVLFPASEADLLIERLVKRREGGFNGKDGVGRWQPCDEEIIGFACALPAGRAGGMTERRLKGANFWRSKEPLGPDDGVTESDKINQRKQQSTSYWKC